MFMAVDGHFGAPLSIGQSRDGFAGGTARLLENVLGQRVQTRQFELGHHLDQAATAHFVAADQRQDVPPGLDGVARVGLDDGQHIFIERSGPYQFEVGNAGALFKHRSSIGCEAASTHIDGVAGGCK